MFLNIFNLGRGEILGILSAMFCGYFTLFYNEIVRWYWFKQNKFPFFYDVYIFDGVPLAEYFFAKPTLHFLQACHKILEGWAVMFLKEWYFAEKLLFFLDLDHVTG